MLRGMQAQEAWEVPPMDLLHLAWVLEQVLVVQVLEQEVQVVHRRGLQQVELELVLHRDS